MATLFVLTVDGRSFSQHPPLCNRRRPTNPVRTFSSQDVVTVTRLPLLAVLVDCRPEPNKYVIPATLPTLMPEPSPEPPAITWESYLQALPLWDQELMSSVHIVDRRRLFDALRTENLLLLASDDGAIDKLGSYGAPMATKEHILVECGGQAQGSNPRSFRGEGYGILVCHLRFHYITRNATLCFRLFCDSESLIKRITASRTLKQIIPRRFLFSKVDVEMQILVAVKGLNSAVEFVHVEGNQDTKYPG
jgi:hypothetical protein